MSRTVERLRAVEELLTRLYLGGGGLRDEDRKKARELVGMLAELERVARRGVLVDAAAGHGYVGLFAAALLGAPHVVAIEREAGRAQRIREAARTLGTGATVEVRAGDVGDAALWPEAPEVAVALHACGAAADAVIAAATGARAKWILVVPCCTAATVEGTARGEADASRLGVARHPILRRRHVELHIAGERALALEAAGYEVTLAEFVPPTVTPHNLLYRARRVGEPRRMAEAQAALDAARR